MATSDVDARIKGRTALDQAVVAGAIEEAKGLLSKGANPYLLDNRNENAVMRAAARRQVELLRIMLRKPGDVNLQNKSGATALHYAAREDCVECVKLLLAAGARKDIVDSHGRLAVDWAKGNSTAALVK